MRRLISSMLLARVSEKATDFLTPLQVGVAVPSACEAVVHSARAAARVYGDDKRVGLLQIDLRNALKIVSRTAFRSQVRRHFPQLHAWTEYCYGEGVNPELWVQDFRFNSVCGVQQGDPLGPLLFSLALHPVLQQLNRKIAGWKQELQLETTHTPSLMAFYLDDGVLVDRHPILQRALSFLGSTEAKRYGLHLCVDKCNLWWPTAPSANTD